MKTIGLQIRSFIFLSLLIPVIYVNAQTVDDYIKEGDKYYNEYNNEKALDTFLKGEKAFPNNWELLWRISRSYVDIGEHMPSSTSGQEDAQFKVYQKSLDYAERAVKQAPDKSVTYLRRAISNGRIALFKGIFSVAGIVNAVRADCEKAIKLGNGGDEIQAISHYVLARTNAEVSKKWKPARSVLGLGWADIDTAFVEYQKAISLRSNFVMFYVDYAEALVREDKYKLAKEMLGKALLTPKIDEDDDMRKEEAKKLLDKIKDED